MISCCFLVYNKGGNRVRLVINGLDQLRVGSKNVKPKPDLFIKWVRIYNLNMSRLINKQSNLICLIYLTNR